MDFNHIAQEMIDAIAPVVSARTVNVMDTNAIIIASSDPKRVGTFHQGAFEVISSGKTVYINKEEVNEYPGAREGINLPIVIDDKLVGVVGIYGDPDNVKDAANLLHAYVTQYLETAARDLALHMQDEIRTNILKMLLFGGSADYPRVEQLAHILGINIEMPVRVFAFSECGSSENMIETAKSMERISHVLLQQKFLNNECDIYGNIDDIFFCIKRSCDIVDFNKYISSVYRIITDDLKFHVSLISSEVCMDTAGIRHAASQITTMLPRSTGCICMDGNEARINYLFRMMYETGSTGFAEDMYKKLEGYFGKLKMEKVMRTVEIYCKNDGGIAAASEDMHIHKNTLLYRMKTIYSVLDLESENDFTKEFFLRLLLIYHNHLKLNN